MSLRQIVSLGAMALIVLGSLHAVHVGKADDVEYYLFFVSMFLAAQGLLTIILVRGLRGGR